MDKPFWHDGCEHGHNNYVASFSIATKLDGAYQERNYDLYVFPERYYGHEICIRYGNEEHEYISPGNIVTLAIHSSNEIYSKALEIVGRRFKFIAERRDK